MVSMIQETRHPVVLIVNDYYALTRRSSALRRLCRTVRFQAINRSAMKNLLRDIATKEGIDVAEDVLDFIVERSQGDLRSAINDLESICLGRKAVRGDATKSVGTRDRERTIFAALEEIFRSGDARRAREAVQALDESPEDLILWVDHNLPFEYTTPGDRLRGMEQLSRAATFLGRVKRRQAYGLWSYASDLMSAGVAVAREGRARGGQLQFPGYLLQMSRSRGARTARNALARKLARKMHTSANLVLNEVLPSFRALFQRDEEFRVQTTAELGLDEKEAAFLLDEAEDSHAVKHLLEKAGRIEIRAATREPESGLGAYDEDEVDAG